MRSAWSGTQLLILANVTVFLLELTAGTPLFSGFALWPVGAGFMPWQLVSYAFLHGGIAHLAFNMFGLWMFGRELEQLLGRRALLELYFASVVSAGAMQLFVTSVSASAYPTVGASGGVFGILLGYAICFPRRIIMLLIPPIPLPAWLFVTLYAVVELTLGLAGTQTGIAHFAHLGGMAGAFLIIRRWRRKRD